MTTLRWIPAKEWALWMVLAVIVLGTAPSLCAAPVESQTGAQAVRREKQAEILATLDLEPVRARLAAAGLDRSEVEALVARLDADQLEELASQAEDIQAGGDATGWVVAGLVLMFIWVLYRYTTWFDWFD